MLAIHTSRPGLAGFLDDMKTWFSPATQALPSIAPSVATGPTASGAAASADEILDHTLVPLRGYAVYLRLIKGDANDSASAKTAEQLLDYAAGGFHVSVARGKFGGCSDKAFGFADGGTKAYFCVGKSQLNREDIRSAWAAAAKAYKDAFDGMDGFPGVAAAKQALSAANQLANTAYALEGVAPPVDPGPMSAGDPPRIAEPAVARRPMKTVTKVGLAVGGVLAVSLAAFGITRGMHHDTHSRRSRR